MNLVGCSSAGRLVSEEIPRVTNKCHARQNEKNKGDPKLPHPAVSDSIGDVPPHYAHPDHEREYGEKIGLRALDGEHSE
jgi:hypothetical protein